MALVERCAAMDQRYKAGSDVMSAAYTWLIIVLERICSEGEP